MNGTFEYVRADDVAAAVALVSGDSEAQYLAGGTRVCEGPATTIVGPESGTLSGYPAWR